MKLLPDTIIKSWLAAKVETRAGEEEKATELKERERFSWETNSTFFIFPYSRRLFKILMKYYYSLVMAFAVTCCTRGWAVGTWNGKRFLRSRSSTLKKKFMHRFCCGLKLDEWVVDK